MINLVVGLPGTGKSYYAIFMIYNILIGNDKASKHIEHIYCNIGGVKFNDFPTSDITFNKLKIDSFFKDYLHKCYNCYNLNQDSDNVDDLLIDISKEYGFYKSLIVFDECHDFFSGQDKIKIWWLTYHRHLFHEIILLTQNKTLIHSKYRGIPELFIEAQPRSKSIFGKSLTFKHYASFTMKKGDQFGKTDLPLKDEIFALYHSGNKSNQKSVVLKYVILFIIMIIVVIAIFYNFIYSFMPKEIEKKEPLKIEKKFVPKIEKKESNSISRKRDIKNKQKEIEKNLKLNQNDLLLTIYCDKKNGCKIFGNFYKYHYFKLFLVRSKSKVLQAEIIQDDFKRYLINTNYNKFSQSFLLPQRKMKK